jgi:membrane associated rhomboid family serine protease
MPRIGTTEYSIGPGSLSQAIKILIGVNVGAFALSLIVPAVTVRLGLMPAMVLREYALWQPLTYMFLHGGISHLLFNMLALWMFGTDLERTWGTRFFVRYYFVTGIGAALVTILWSLTPLPYAEALYSTLVVGASGAIYGLLLAYGMYFPHRTVFLYVFPVPARYAGRYMRPSSGWRGTRC